MKQALLHSENDIQVIKRAAKLGTSPDAQVMAEYNQKVADARDGQSFVEALERFGEVLDEAEAAITQAMKNYQNVEDDNRQAFGQ